MKPRPYLSWSQLNMVESSPEMYRRVYIEGNKFPTNSGIDFGKKFADSIEIDEETGDPMFDMVASSMPKLDIMEKALKVNIKIGSQTIPLFGKADTAKENLSKIYEYKTGVTPWNQKKVDNHGQLTFYSLMAKELTDKIPELKLIWAETEKINNRIEFTGNIEIFETERTLIDLIKMQVRIKKAWNLIIKMCDEYV